MKTVSTLIRLSKLEVDNRRRLLADLLEQDAAFDRAIDRVDTELDTERQKARETPEYGAGFVAYAKHAASRRKALVDRKAALAVDIDTARDRLAEAFEEQKKYEITAERQEEEETAEENKREQQDLDELGLQTHSRNTGR
ncbi:flagellar export protein FliJ [Hwanghaeella grinnelliae]|uniref:Flagellar export protein FliJ n=1 Tax=Hwanghaeella grinnelliae TaxID=2500179 RepID=A0A3S2Z4N7_9PROT|nr:flagellar export protein FliJ [Hwanghaeella grinnelliae]RVU33720.1 flagellar export protein FliJ [Hwanghaeella grinnelliae]